MQGLPISDGRREIHRGPYGTWSVQRANRLDSFSACQLMCVAPRRTELTQELRFGELTEFTQSFDAQPRQSLECVIRQGQRRDGVWRQEGGEFFFIHENRLSRTSRHCRNSRGKRSGGSAHPHGGDERTGEDIEKCLEHSTCLVRRRAVEPLESIYSDVHDTALLRLYDGTEFTEALENRLHGRIVVGGIRLEECQGRAERYGSGHGHSR